MSGKLMTEDWILKLAGFLHGPDWDIADTDTAADGTVTTVCQPPYALCVFLHAKVKVFSPRIDILSESLQSTDKSNVFEG